MSRPLIIFLDDTEGELGSSSPFSEAHHAAAVARLPAPTLANLPEIERLIRLAQRGAPMRDRISDDIISSVCLIYF